MAILEKEVWVSLASPNIKHFETLGYEIPRVKSKWGKMHIPKGTKILVKVEDLTKRSHVKLTKICDDCGITIPEKPLSTILITRERSDGKDRCHKCGTVYGIEIREEKRVVKGINDLWTTHHYVATLLKYAQQGYEITAGSERKTVFICEHCGLESNVRVNNVINQGFSCTKCSDGVSYPEKFMFECLTQLNIHFEYQKTFVWSKNISHINPKLNGTKKYDFYIPLFNCIIETHGEQHFDLKRVHFNNKISRIEHENDELKKMLAIQNGFEEENYVSLNCEKSKMDHIKDEILSSRMSAMFNLDHIDWFKCHETACHSLVKTACDLWNIGNKVTKISELIKLNRTTVVRYLKQGKSLGWCDYDPKEEQRLGAISTGKKNAREIVQLSLDGEFIKHWESMAQIENVLGISKGHIPSVCKGRRKKASGFKWMYKEDYEKTILGS